MIASSARILENVELGENAQIGEFVVIGEPPSGRKPGELKTVIGRNAVVRSHTVIYAGNVIGDGFQAGHGALIREQNTIGHGVSVGSHSVIEHHVEVADGARVHSNVFIPEYSRLEQSCWVGPNAVFTNAPYPQSPGAKASLKGPTVGTRARVGANATLLPGVQIGAEALVGAGSVVVDDVPPGGVVVGNPAKLIKFTHDMPAYQLGDK